MAAGKGMDAMDLVPEYAAKTGADMQFKSYYWLMGAIGAGRGKGQSIGLRLDLGQRRRGGRVHGRERATLPRIESRRAGA